MAILVTGGVNSSQIKGKIGNNVFKRVNRQTVISAYQPIVKNPNTRAQQFVRMKFMQVSGGSRLLYDRAFRKYGIKLKGHSAYTSINRMNFNNPVVKSVGYADNFLPEFPKKYQRLIGCNTNLSNEIFNYLDFRVIRSNNTSSYYIALSIPKGMFNYTPSGSLGKIYLGTNIPLDSLTFEVLLQGIYQGTFKLPLLNFAINERYGLDSDDTALAKSVDNIGGMYKYTLSFTETLDMATDPQNSGNYLIGLSDPLTYANFGASADPFIECWWRGVEKVNRVGALILMFSTPQEATDLNDNEVTPILSRELMLAVNCWSSVHTES